MTPGLVWGMNLKCPWITFGVKNACGMTFPEHFLRVAGFGQITHPNSVISTSSMMLGYGQASNFRLKSTYWKGFSKFSGIGSQYSQNIYSAVPADHWLDRSLVWLSKIINWINSNYCHNQVTNLFVLEKVFFIAKTIHSRLTILKNWKKLSIITWRFQRCKT